jgi:hypothetical protein
MIRPPQFRLRSLFILTAVAAVESWWLSCAIPERHFQPDDDFLISLMCAVIAAVGYAVYRAVNYPGSRRKADQRPMPTDE